MKTLHLKELGEVELSANLADYGVERPQSTFKKNKAVRTYCNKGEELEAISEYLDEDYYEILAQVENKELGHKFFMLKNKERYNFVTILIKEIEIETELKELKPFPSSDIRIELMDLCEKEYCYVSKQHAELIDLFATSYQLPFALGNEFEDYNNIYLIPQKVNIKPKLKRREFTH
jgi:hypothetical protein